MSYDFKGPVLHRVVLLEKYVAVVSDFDLAEAFAEFETTREGQWAVLNTLQVDYGWVGSNRAHGDATLLFVAYLTDILYTDYILRFK